MNTSILEGLGLSKGEIKVYLTLLELGATKVGKVIEKSGMASSAVHNSMNSLIDKGLVSYIKKRQIKFYQAVPPKQLIDFIEDKKKKVLEILPELEIKQKFAKEKQEAEIFEGEKGIIAMLNRLIEDAKKGEEYYFFATYLEKRNEEIQKFFRKFDTKRAEKGLIVKGIAHTELKKLFLGREIFKIKYAEFPIPSDISIFKEKVAFIAWADKPVGYLIRSHQLYDMFRNYFNQIWDTL